MGIVDWVLRVGRDKAKQMVEVPRGSMDEEVEKSNQDICASLQQTQLKHTEIRILRDG